MDDRTNVDLIKWGVFCGQCRHFADKHLSSWDSGFEECCLVAKSPGTRVTYKGVEFLPPLKPSVRNANNDCPDWEAKHGADERDVSGVE